MNPGQLALMMLINILEIQSAYPGDSITMWHVPVGSRTFVWQCATFFDSEGLMGDEGWAMSDEVFFFCFLVFFSYLLWQHLEEKQLLCACAHISVKKAFRKPGTARIEGTILMRAEVNGVNVNYLGEPRVIFWAH